MSDERLNVWYEDILVGRLWQDATGKLGFQYEKDWVNQGFPISQQLPLIADEYSPAQSLAHRFFANLLPEANARAHVVRDLKISNSEFELLKAIGGECAGALSILPSTLPPDTKPFYQQLSEEEFKKILLRKGNLASLTSEKNRPRLSLAGAQDKCAIFFDQHHYFLPQGSAPSTHIIKFEVTDYGHIPAYEYLLTELAKTIHLPVVNCEFKQLDRHRFLLIERYDRILQNQKIKRLHQEDFCQALGIDYAHKYQQEGGPSFYDCYQLIKNISANPLIDSENVLKWQIFNVLAGNSDGHAKNLSFIYDEKQQARLAPFYDLVCTRAIERIDSRLALSVGGEFNPDKINRNHWSHFAETCNIGTAYLQKLILNIAETLLDNMSITINQFEAQHGKYPALQRAKMVVEKRCKKALT